MVKNVVSIDCPSHQQLIQLLDDTVEDDMTIVEHVSKCATCQIELDRLTDSSPLNSYREIVKGNKDVGKLLDPPLHEGDLGSLGEFAIEAQIGAGGMGVVFRGRDARLDRQVAAKVLSRRSSPDSDARFVRESKAAAKLSHDHVVPVYSSGRTKSGAPYFVMQLIEGPSLKDRIRSGKMDEREAAEMVRGVALGLNAAHELDLIHRDVKPTNILIDKNDGRAKLMDFGLVRATDDATLTQANVICGTPEYMSPEQIADSHSQDKRGDIYSLGITLYECLTGTAPFRGQPLQVLQQHQTTPPIRPAKLNTSISRDLETICLKAISKEPVRRYQNARQFANDLENFLKGRPVVAREITGAEKLRMWCSRNPGIAWLTATSVGLLLALGIGSTVAAVSLNAANKTAKLESEKAATAEELAVNDRAAAIDAMANLVDSLYDELSNDAASIKTREKVVNAAIEGLKSVTTAAQDREADETIARAYLQMGDLLSLRGSNQEAEKNLQDSIAMYKSLLELAPDDEEAKCDLAFAHQRLGLHYSRVGDSKSIASVKQGRMLIDEVLAKNPNHEEGLLNLAKLHIEKLKEIRSGGGNNADVIQYGETAIEDVKRLLEMSPNDKKGSLEAQAIHFCIGRAYLESFKVDKAGEHFAAARPHLDRALEKSPNNVQLRAASAILDRAHGMVLGSLAKFNDANVKFESALQTLKALAAANPDDVSQIQNVANTQTIYSESFKCVGDHVGACELLEDSIKIYKKLLAIAPEDQNIRMLIANARLSKANSEIRLSEFARAKETLGTLIEEVDGFEFEGPMLAQKTFFRTIATTLHEGASLMLKLPVETRTASGEFNTLLWVAVEDAQTATTYDLSKESLSLIANIAPEFEGKTFGELLEYVTKIPDVSPGFAADFPGFEACVYGMLAENISESDLKDKERLTSIALKQTLDVIRKFVEENPNKSMIVLSEPRLGWVCDTPEFKALWDELGVPGKE